MLQRLYLKNFILIDEIELEFIDGFSVFLGETGAGKSLIVDALQIIAGAKANADVIKLHQDKALIEASFVINNPQVKHILEDLGLDCSEEIIITKEISPQKTTTRLNRRTITNTFLRQIMQYLIDIHTQHALNNFLDSKSHLELLDSIYHVDLTNYQSIYMKYKSKLQAKQELIDSKSLDLDYLKFQLNEIMNVDPKEDEDELLLKQQQEYIILQKKQTEVTKALENIELSGVLSLAKIFDHELLESHYYDLEDTINQIVGKIEAVDESEINNMQERLFTIQGLKRKYGPTLTNVLEKKNDLIEKINLVEENELLLFNLEKEITVIEHQLISEANLISNNRKHNAQELSRLIINELKELNFSYIDFQVAFQNTDFNNQGIDKIQFLISLNKGEPLKPIIEVASGGELSRILLALKTIFSKNQLVDTLVFDEIDTGVSGKVSLAIGKKMFKIGQNKQVLSVTHLPAVVACANQCFEVSKHDNENTTTSKVKQLSYPELVNNIAIMSSSNLSEIALENAKELLEFAKKELLNV